MVVVVIHSQIFAVVVKVDEGATRVALNVEKHRIT